MGRRGHVGLDRLEKVVMRDAQREPLQVADDRRLSITRHWAGAGGGIGGVGPAIAWRSAATSPTDRAIGPTVSIDQLSGTPPGALDPAVRHLQAHHAAKRGGKPDRSASVAAERPNASELASAEALPPLLPPGIRDGSQGFLQSP